MFKTGFRIGPAIVPVVMVLGLITGLTVRPTIDEVFFADPDGTSEDGLKLDSGAVDIHGSVTHEDHVALSQQAFQNLKLSLTTVELSDYTQRIHMPGEIVEAPGRSVQKVAASVSGSVTRLLALPGISVVEGEPLFEITIIDDDLMHAQLRFLELLTKREIVEAELARLKPLTSTGAIPGRKRLELQYQKKEIESSLILGKRR